MLCKRYMRGPRVLLLLQRGIPVLWKRGLRCHDRMLWVESRGPECSVLNNRTPIQPRVSSVYNHSTPVRRSLPAVRHHRATVRPTPPTTWCPSWPQTQSTSPPPARGARRRSPRARGGVPTVWRLLPLHQYLWLLWGGDVYKRMLFVGSTRVRHPCSQYHFVQCGLVLVIYFLLTYKRWTYIYQTLGFSLRWVEPQVLGTFRDPRFKFEHDCHDLAIITSYSAYSLNFNC